MVPRAPTLYVFEDQFLLLHSLGLELPHHTGTLFVLVQAFDMGWAGLPYYIDAHFFSTRKGFEFGRTVRYRRAFGVLPLLLGSGQTIEGLHGQLNGDGGSFLHHHPYDGIRLRIHSLLNILEGAEGREVVEASRGAIGRLPPTLYDRDQGSADPSW
ncbi:hypothetical protein EV182_002524 [Spiromyces aspiralis]|uniref:Uncharacterized protein n=1 Tax=Spiromyces aspiralis TaxID=68401 RepID=A0ACC1HTW2_9FUNG|nr:hypothetical protein EV182_002524 [Spiromyces aspiralis]